MTSIDSGSTAKQSASIQYSPITIARAERALRCTPFRLPLLVATRQQSVGLKAIAGKAGVQNGYTSRPVAELVAESDLLWLIQVGVLRREVDGQGLTDSFRLTPLGQQITERHQVAAQHQPGMSPDPLSSPSLSDRLYNAVSRWIRLPI
jgi:hypothetical protein